VDVERPASSRGRRPATSDGRRTSLAATLVRAWAERFARNNLLTYASAIAFQLLIAGAALAFLAVALLQPLGLVHVWTRSVAPTLASHLPATWFVALRWSVERETSASPLAPVLLGTALSVWEVSGAVRAAMGALNRIYETRETRGLVRRFLVSLLLAVAVALLAIVAAFVWTAGFGLASIADWPLRLAAVALLCWAMLTLIVLVAPARRQPWHWVSVGSLGNVAAWLALSAVYGVWISRVVRFGSVDGALTAVISTTGYLYACAVTFLVATQLDQMLREGGLDAALGR
jgi:membrane protein